MLKLFEVMIKKQCPYINAGLLKNAPLSTPSYLPNSAGKQEGQVKPYEIANIQLFLLFYLENQQFHVVQPNIMPIYR